MLCHDLIQAKWEGDKYTITPITGQRNDMNVLRSWLKTCLKTQVKIKKCQAYTLILTGRGLGAVVCISDGKNKFTLRPLGLEPTTQYVNLASETGKLYVEIKASHGCNHGCGKKGSIPLQLDMLRLENSFVGRAPPIARRGKIVMTNDDGVTSPSLTVMRDRFVEAGYDVTIVAPSGQSSASSMGLDITNTTINILGNQTYSVSKRDGTTVTAATAAVHFPLVVNPQEVDLVISGINEGLNNGTTALVSGTVGAANLVNERLNSNIPKWVPAIAVSSAGPNFGSIPPQQREDIIAFMLKFVDSLYSSEQYLRTGKLLPQRLGMNINYPPIASSEVKGVQITRQGLYGPTSGNFTPQNPATSGVFYDLESSSPTELLVRVRYADVLAPDIPGSDSMAVGYGFISVEPIVADFTADPAYTFSFMNQLQGLARSFPISGTYVPPNFLLDTPKKC